MTEPISPWVSNWTARYGRETEPSTPPAGRKALACAGSATTARGTVKEPRGRKDIRPEGKLFPRKESSVTFGRPGQVASDAALPNIPLQITRTRRSGPRKAVISSLQIP